MSDRLHATIAIGRRRLYESLIHPGYYVALTAGLAVAYAFAAGFVRSIDSSGFDYTLNPLYNFVGGMMSGAFGAPFVGRVFARGPFLFAAHISFLPVLLYLAMTSIYRFGTEKSSGAIELLCYGPADGTSYFLASLSKDVILTAVSLAAFLGFFVAAGLVENLAITTALLVSLPLLFFSALCIYSYGVLVSVISDGANTALALFITGVLVFGISLVGSQAIVGGYLQSLSTVAAWVLKWFSPFFYWSFSMKAWSNDQIGLLFVGLLGQMVLTTTVLVGSHFLAKAKGVRP